MDREALVHLMGGAVGSTVSTSITYPLELVKTRVQSSLHHVRSKHINGMTSPAFYICKTVF